MAGFVGLATGLTQQSMCEPCPMGTYSAIPGIVNFEDCEPCPMGTWSNQTGKDEVDICYKCERGRYRNLTRGIHKKDCFKCPPGRASIQLGADSLEKCIECPAGKYMEADSDDIACLQCPSGWSQPEKAAFFCNICSTARFAKDVGSPSCEKCRAGTFGVVEGASACQLCTEGRYQEEEEQQFCVDCEIGRFNNCQGSGWCFECNAGTTTFVVASTFCSVKRVQTIPAAILDNLTFILPTGSNISYATSFQVVGAAGAAGTNGITNRMQPTPLLSRLSTAVPSGETDNSNDDINRDPTDSSFSFSSTPVTTITGLCVTWTLPAPTDPVAIMLNQDVEWSTSRLFEYSFTNKTTVTNTTTQLCLPIHQNVVNMYNRVIYIRVTPTIDDAKGTSSAPSKVWSVAPSCDDESYLDADSSYVSRWRCRPCPIGGDCRGPRRWQEVGVIFGYFRLHDVDRDPERIVETSFWRCFKPEACLGSRNPKMEGRYFSNLVDESRLYDDTSTNSNSSAAYTQMLIDLAGTEIAPERCNKAHGFAKVCPGAPESRCRLCRGCAEGYWPEGYANCKQCPTKVIQGLSIVAGVLGVSMTLYLFLQTALGDAGMSGRAKGKYMTLHGCFLQFSLF